MLDVKIEQVSCHYFGLVEGMLQHFAVFTKSIDNSE
jgi:hypothetical protein